MKLGLLEMTPHPVYHCLQEYLRLCHSLNFDSDPDYDSLEACLNSNRHPIPAIFNDLFEDAYALFKARLSKQLLPDAANSLGEHWERWERAIDIIKRVDKQINQQKIGSWFEQWRDEVSRRSLGVAAQLRKTLGVRDAVV